jgi:hypothetical protein
LRKPRRANMGGCSSSENRQNQEAQTRHKDVPDWWLWILTDSDSPTKSSMGSLTTVEAPFLRFQDNNGAFKGRRASEEGGNRRMMNHSHVLNAMMSDRSTSKKSKSKTNVGSRGSSRRRDSWIAVPDPLPSWTIEEQQAFLDILDEHPKAGRDSAQLDLVIRKALNRIPTKTESELHKCLIHVEACRVAYFGRKGVKNRAFERS